jgi:plasmid stabilization system protein ParE
MPDPDSPEKQTAGPPLPAGPLGVESTADWSLVLDRLISWAVSQGDAAVDQIYDYLVRRSAEQQPRRSHDLIPGSASGYARRSTPYRGRGQDQACSSLRRRLRSRHGCIARPPGTRRPPRQRRISG